MRTPIELIAISLKDYKQEATTLIGYSAWILVPFAAVVFLSILPVSPVVQLIAFCVIIVELYFILWVINTLALHAYAHIHNHDKNTAVLSAKARELIPTLLMVLFILLLVLLGGLILFLIPFFLFLVWFGLSPFLVIFEQKRGLDAFSASKTMTQNRFWPCAGMLIGGPLIILITYFVIMSLLISIICATQGIDPIVLLQPNQIPLWADVLEAVGEVFLLPLMMIYFTYTYLELKNSPSIKLAPKSDLT